MLCIYINVHECEIVYTNGERKYEQDQHKKQKKQRIRREEYRNRRRREVEQTSGITGPVDRVVLSLRSDHSKEVTLWEVVRGRDNGLSSRPSLLSSHMCHVAGAFEIQYNTIQ